jgi:hypothetical protein
MRVEENQRAKGKDEEKRESKSKNEKAKMKTAAMFRARLSRELGT